MPGPSDKTELRRRMRAQRLRLARERPDGAELAAAQLPAEALPRFAVVSGYHAMGTELDPLPVLLRFALAGARLALPVAEDRDAPLVFRAWSPGDLQVPDAFG
ncbi:MAG TPA: 5-formyltetrahydrofolate cyclo-ligase, partial [Phenylobacterium sp.]|nr:5-formyltetrahydrofolate cyclo-ligase [Phenylobacterium sp.]